MSPYRIAASTRVDAEPSRPRRWGLTLWVRLVLRLGLLDERRRDRRELLEYYRGLRAYERLNETWRRHTAVMSELRRKYPELADDLRRKPRPIPPCPPPRRIAE